MNWTGKISSFLSIFLLTAFLFCSYDGYSKQYEKQLLNKKNKTEKEEKDEKEKEIISVAIQATISAFAIEFNKAFDFSTQNFNVRAVLKKSFIPHSGTVDVAFFRILFSRITPVNAP